MNLTQATSSTEPDIGSLSEGELIDDRALESREEDAFRLSDIVDELLGICRQAPTPATIALYASWGSGKSSLGRILKKEFEDDKEIAYAQFNALKYAERTPLQRHFLSQVAAAFDIDDSKFSRDLYKAETGTDFKLSVEKVWRLVGLLAATVFAVIGTIAVFALVASAISSGHPYWHSVGQTLRGSATGVVLSATLLTAVLAILSQSLRVDTQRSAPSSSEEFERLFKELVADVIKKTKRSRLVVFIDELDRCSPDQVVSVLETLRTFLEVEQCVFVVAADQQALERAATEAARQSTPVNPGNPYYSAGSAYLDKIFQYQFPMPPLLPRRLSRFALDLIRDRPGVWQEIPNQPELVSVLIPTHVRSPRRVKALLNSFALSFRLALTRSTESAESRLDPGVATRASEIGKLVCLRTEFPLFAADLQLDARLPQLTLMLRDTPTLTLETCGLHGVAPEAFSRARAYAREELPVDEVIVRTTEHDTAMRPATAQSSTSAASLLQPADGDEEEPAGDERESVEVNHARQLIRYLERTRDIQGPGRDLVYLESPGAAFGLPGELAEQLENDALDGQAAAVTSAVNGVTDDDQYFAALRLLARLVVEAIGIDAQNVLSALLSAVGSSSRSLDPVVDELLTAVASYRSGYEFKPADLEGALRLSLQRDTEAALEVRGTVLERPEALSDAQLRELILKNAGTFVTVDSPGAVTIDSARVARIFTAHLADADPDSLSALLATLPFGVVQAICEQLDGSQSDEELTTLAQTAAAAQAQQHGDLGELLLRTLVGFEPASARTAAELVLSDFAPVATPATVNSILNAAPRRVLSSWPIWLDVLDPATVAGDGEQERLASFVPLLWQRRFDPSGDQPAGTAEDFEAASDSLARLAPNGLSVPAEVSDKLLVDLAPTPVTTQPEVPQREGQIAALWSLVARKLLSSARAGSIVLTDLAATLSASSVHPILGQGVSEYVVAEGSRALRDADKLGSFGEALKASPWIDDASRLILRARVGMAASRLGLAMEDELVGADLVALKDLGSAEALETLSDWLRSTKPSPESITGLFDAETRSRTLIRPELRNTVGQIAESWSADDKATFFEHLAPLYHAGEGGTALLRLGHAQEAASGRVVATLQRLFEESGNNEARDRVLKLWAIARPAEASAQRALADTIYIPLLGKGKDATKLALTHFDLVQHMTGAPRNRVKQALQEATRNDSELGKRADKRMRDAGWIKRKKPWWNIT